LGFLVFIIINNNWGLNILGDNNNVYKD